MEATIASSRYHYHPKLSSSPSLHDTSTTTTESWSTVSAGRRTPQQQLQQPMTNSPLSSTQFFPKTRPQSQQNYQEAASQSHRSRVAMAPLKSYRAVNLSPSAQHRDHQYILDAQQLHKSGFQHNGRSLRVTQSEPGRGVNGFLMNESINRISMLSLDDGPVQKTHSSHGEPQMSRFTSENANGITAPVTERINRYNHRGPYQEHQQSDEDCENDDNSDHEEEWRSDVQELEQHSQQAENDSYDRQPFMSGPQQVSNQASQLDVLEDFQPLKRSRSESQIPRQPQLSPLPDRFTREFHFNSQRLSPSFSRQSPVLTNGEMASESLPTAPKTLKPPSPEQRYDQNIETPSSASVRDLQRQLWNNDETLQVAIPPTLSYANSIRRDDRRQSSRSGKTVPRYTRSLSPGRRNNLQDSTDPNQRFNSKFYEAAIRARLRGKVHPTDVSPPASYRHDQKSNSKPAQTSRQESNANSVRNNSFSDRSRNSESSGGHTNEPLQNALIPRVPSNTSQSNKQAPSQHAKDSKDCRALESLRTSYGGVAATRPPTPNTNGSSRSSWVQTISRDRSYEKPPATNRALVCREETMISSNSINARDRDGSVKRGRGSESVRRGRDASIERQGRGTSVERGRETFERRCRDASIERRGRGTSVERGRETFERRCRDASVERSHIDDSIRRGRSLSRDRPPVIQGDRAPIAGVWRSQISQTRRYSDRSQSPRPSHVKSSDSNTKNARSFSGDQSSPLKKIPSREQSPRGFRNSWNGRNWADTQNRSEEMQHDRQIERSFSTPNGTHVANLVAKLNAVRRDCPTKALAEIDSILRQESHSSSGDGDDPIHADTNECDGRVATEESDEETSVSSITNPTYQSATANDDFQFYDQNSSDPFSNPFASIAMSNPHAPSTATFRRPRPSNLQSYAASTSEVVRKPEPTSKRKERKKGVENCPPPSSIKVKETAKIQRVVQDDPSEKDLSVQNSATAQICVPPLKASEVVSGKSKVDNFVADSEELANKIRLWDEMSTGVERPKSSESLKKPEASGPRRSPSPALQSVVTEDLGSIMTPISPTRPKSAAVARRSHPWDGTMGIRHEKLNTKDANMEGEAGIELEIANRNIVEHTDHQGQVALLAPEPLRRTNSTPGFHSISGFVGECFPVDPKLLNHAPRIDCERPTSTHPTTQQNKNKMSDSFDAAWVAVPSSSFFPEAPCIKPTSNNPFLPEQSLQPQNSNNRDNRYKRSPLQQPQREDNHKKPSIRLKIPNQNTPTLFQRGEPKQHPGIEVSLLENSSPVRPVEKEFRPVEKEKEVMKEFVESEWDKEEGNSTKRRGFLRSLMKKKKGSFEKSRSSTPVTSRPSREQQIYSSFTENPRNTERGPGYGSKSDRRSNSLERFRPPRMAQKLSRVMRLYDHD